MTNKPTSPRSSSSGHSFPWGWLFLVGFVAAFAIWGKPSSTVAERSREKVDERWLKLVANVSDASNRYGDDLAIYIKDLRTGQVFEHNADKPFVSASLIKLPIMIATYQAVHDGLLSLDDKIKIRNRHRRQGSGRLKWARSGTSYTVAALVHEMITRSDNTATAMVIEKLGYDYLNRNFKRFGLETTRISASGMSLSDRLPPSKDNYTTAREMGYLLERVYRHGIVSDGLSDLMLSVLKSSQRGTRLAAYLPKQWKLAHKTGLLRKHCHDVGIVFTPSRDYVICVLTGPHDSYRKAKGIIAAVGKQTYESLKNS